MVDRGPRTTILAVSLGIASIATAAGAWVTEFGHLAAARIVVGLAQAALVPAAYSLIGDIVPVRQSGRAMAIFACGPLAGSGLMLMTGSVLATSLGWAAAFLALGGAGVVVTIALGSLSDPPRRPHARRAEPGASSHLRSHWRPIIDRARNDALHASAGHILLSWTVSWLMRGHGADGAMAAWTFGVAVLVGGITGTLCAGAIGDALLRRYRVSRLFELAAAALPGALVALLTFATENTTVAAALLYPMLFLLAAAHGTGPVALQDITPAGLRGRQHGAAVLLISLFGFALGPWLVRLASDRNGGTEALGNILGIAVPVLLAISGVTALLGARVHARAAAALIQETAPGRPSATA